MHIGRPSFQLAAGILATAVALSIAWAETPNRPEWLVRPEGRRPSILLITIDTLRADHLGWSHGAQKSITPNLDRFTQEAAVFDVATTPATATRPAIASLLTGKYPGRHTVVHNQGQLGDDDVLFPELLGEAGYENLFLYGNDLLAPDSGLTQGIQSTEGHSRYMGSADEPMASRAIEWLSAREKSPTHPFFLWLHLMDPHGPYFSAPESVRDHVPRRDGLQNQVLDVADGNYARGKIPKYQRLRETLDTETYRWRYRAEIHHTDRQIGRVLEALDDLGFGKTSIVVVTADHGESLGEHDRYFQHGWDVYDPSARVPLAIRLPGIVPVGRIEQPVSLVDIPPTLLRGLGLDAPPGIEGVDLAPLILGRPTEARPVFTRSACPNDLVSVRLGDFKLIHTPPRESTDGWSFETPGWQLVSLSDDPEELRDASTREPRMRAHLEGLVLRWEQEHQLAERRPIPAPPTDEALRRQLELLGYIDE